MTTCPAGTLRGREQRPSARRYRRGVNEQSAPVVPRRLATAVCLAEAVAVLLFAVLLVRSGVVGDAADVSAAYLQAAIAVLVAVALAVLAVALARGRRWPLGLFVTTQLFIAVVALSQLGAVLRGGQEWVMLVILAAGLVAAAVGLWSAARLSTAYHRTPPGSAARGRG